MQRLVLLLILVSASIAPASAGTIAIIGTGNVGSALGTEFAEEGHKVVYGSRNPTRQAVLDLVARTGKGASAMTQAEAVKHADIVVLAVPGMLVSEITRVLGDLDGKIIIDPTNPLLFTDGGVRHGADTSNAEIIQAAAPGARVVKAFNTLGWEFMMNPDESGGPITIPLAGDDAAAKSVVADLVRSIDLHPLDVGSLEMARWVEGIAILLVNNNFGPLPDFNVHLREME